MKIETVGQSLNRYFEGHRFFKILLPLDVAIVYAAAALGVVFTFINAGALETVVYYLGILGWLLVFSKSNYLALAIGLAAQTFTYCYYVLSSLIKYQNLNLVSLVSICVFGYLSFSAYRKSIALTK